MHRCSHSGTERPDADLVGAYCRPSSGRSPRDSYAQMGIVLRRMDTAGLEATSVAGLGNKVGLGSAPELDASKAHNEYGSLEINRLGGASITNTVEEGTGRRRKTKEVFAHVRAMTRICGLTLHGPES